MNNKAEYQIDEDGPVRDFAGELRRAKEYVQELTDRVKELEAAKLANNREIDFLRIALRRIIG